MANEMKRDEVEKLPWREVESSNVRRVAFGVRVHDEFIGECDVGELYVEFRGSPGRVYRYDGVSFEEHGALLEAESVGGYLNAEIKGSFESTRFDVLETPPGPPTPPRPETHRPVG